MANPTTYFGWVMPNSADLVTDLPADFAVFGQGVDTSMQYLLGGTTGQVLSKTSATNMAFTWVTPTDQTPLTTKGDLFAFTTVDARLAVGSNNQTLYADSSAATGLAWGASAKSTLTTTGDIVYASAANTLARLGIGSSAQVLSVSGGIPAWTTPAGGGKVLQVVYGATATSTASSSSTQANTNLSASITPTLNTSKVLVLVAQNGCAKDAANSGNSLGLFLYRGATSILQFGNEIAHTNTTVRNDVGSNSCNYLDSPATTSATTYSTKFNSTNNTATVNVQNGANNTSTMILMEIGA